MTKHYILRVGDAVHFRTSSSKYTWGINSNHPCAKGFLNTAKPGDLLWFVESGANGKIVAVATFTSTNRRILGPLLALTATDEELGWDKIKGEWDVEVHYKDLYNLTHCNLLSEIQSPLVIRRYSDKCKVNLVAEYPNIVRYLKVTTSM
jgi:hypothetical protein